MQGKAEVIWYGPKKPTEEDISRLLQLLGEHVVVRFYKEGHPHVQSIRGALEAFPFCTTMIAQMDWPMEYVNESIIPVWRQLRGGQVLAAQIGIAPTMWKFVQVSSWLQYLAPKEQVTMTEGIDIASLSTTRAMVAAVLFSEDPEVSLMALGILGTCRGERSEKIRALDCRLWSLVTLVEVDLSYVLEADSDLDRTGLRSVRWVARRAAGTVSGLGPSIEKPQQDREIERVWDVIERVWENPDGKGIITDFLTRERVAAGAMR